MALQPSNSESCNTLEMTNDSDVLKTDDKDFVEVDLEGSQSQIDGKSNLKMWNFQAH